MQTDRGNATQGWREAWAIYAHPRVAGMFFLGFSSGLPFLLVFSTLSAWLALAGVKVATIGYFSWVGLSYSLKFFWAPIIDRLPLPMLTRWLGRRRAWLLLAQCGVAAGLAGIAASDPARNLSQVAWLAIGVAFASATQDICVDAWRIEAVGMERQGAMAAVYQFGYRVAMLAAGAGALLAASAFGWHWAYLAMAWLMAVGVVTTLIVPEPDTTATRAVWQDEPAVSAFRKRASQWPELAREFGAWLTGAVICPFADFFRRNELRAAILILAFVCLYRLAYFTMGVMANPFYLHLGFTLDQIATVSKVFGVIMTMIGAGIGGWMVARYGLLKTLLVGLLLVGVANVYFSAMTSLPHPGTLHATLGQGVTLAHGGMSAHNGHPTLWDQVRQVWSLALAITIDNLGSGIEGTAFIAYLSSLTNVAYTATQYALFSSLWSLPGKVLDGFSGLLVDHLGYPVFFLYTAALTLPALGLLWLLMRRQTRDGIASG